MIKIAIYERGETFVHRITIRTRESVKEDPSSAQIEIKDPCGWVDVDYESMTKDTTGEYFYNYDIDSSATYGRYKSTVSIGSSGNNVSVLREEFYVMPWNLVRDVRQITGISETKDVDDDTISDIAWHSYLFALRDAHQHHYKALPRGNPDTGTGFDGTNTTFQTPDFPIADINGDGNVYGNNVSCATDVDGWWIDEDGSWHRAIVVVNREQNGEINIYQSDGATAIPSTENGVYLDYWTEWESFDEIIFRRAVAHLAAHEVEQRFRELGNVTLADLNANKPIVMSNPNRFMKEYKRYMNMIRKPRCGVV